MKLHHLISDGWLSGAFCATNCKNLSVMAGRAQVADRLRRNTGCMSARSVGICKAPPAEMMRLTGQRSSRQSYPRAKHLAQGSSAAVSPARWESAKSYLLPKVSAMR